jgi:hypothetical protein
MGNFDEVRIKNGKSVIIQASVKLAPDQAARITGFEFVIRSSQGEQVVDPAGFHSRH